MNPAASLLDGVTPEQRTAITHVNGPLLVLAGAGSGKTLVITRRLAHLIHQGVPAGSILAVTFTNKAAREMRERIMQLVPAERLWVSTFHSFAARFLRQEIERLGYPRAFTIYDESDRVALVSSVLKELNIDPDLASPAALAATISRAKNERLSPRALERRSASHFVTQTARVYARYENSLKAAGALDFDDLLLKLLQLLEDHEDVRERWCRRFQYLLVDEYQDTNAIQYALVRILGSGHRNVCVTGDPDQAIYTWRGADIQNILSFERDFADATVVKLEQNFRSVGNVLAAADAVIGNNRARRPKRLWTDGPDGDPIRVIAVTDEIDEARHAVRLVREHQSAGGSLDEAAVFYRTNALSRSLERAFLEAGIPYEVVGTVAFYERREVKDVIAYLRTLVNPADDLSLLRVLNTPPRGIGTRTIEHLKAFAVSTGLRLRAVLDHLDEVPGLRPRARKALAAFQSLLTDLDTRRQDGPGDLLETLIERIQFVDHLERQGDVRSAERVENVEELIASAREFEARTESDRDLVTYLEDVALVSQADLYGRDEARVSLMTIHNAKGLEFDLVVLAAFEEGLLPHGRSIEAGEDALEEERRLCYVAITRARKQLVLVHADTRTSGGMVGVPRMPSRFLREIPPSLLEHHTSRGRFGGGGLAPRESAAGRSDTQWTDDVPEFREPQAATQELEAGQLVRHEMFGVGRVLRVEGRGPGRKVRIRFTTCGERLLVVEYANLTVVN